MSRFEKASDRFWHCYVGNADDTYPPRMEDMTKRDLIDKVIKPWKERRPLVINNRIFRDHDAIKRVKIVHTSQPADLCREIAGARGTSAMYAAFHQGQDFTSDLLEGVLASVEPVGDVALLLQLCKRLKYAVKPLTGRRKGKKPFVIQDEYDVQDLLHAVVRAHFKYAVNEQPLKKLGNAKATRADFALDDLGVIIELKYVHGPDDQKRVVTELSEDLHHYEQWEHLKAFLYVVYNSDDLQDPEALDKLSCTRKVREMSYDLHVVRA